MGFIRNFIYEKAKDCKPLRYVVGTMDGLCGDGGYAKSKVRWYPDDIEEAIKSVEGYIADDKARGIDCSTLEIRLRELIMIRADLRNGGNGHGTRAWEIWEEK